MSGEYAERIMVRAAMLSARMAKRLSYIEDLFVKYPIIGRDGVVNFEEFFKAADECGHVYGADNCTCALCEQLRTQIKPIIQRVMASQQPQQGAQ